MKGVFLFPPYSYGGAFAGVIAGSSGGGLTYGYPICPQVFTTLNPSFAFSLAHQFLPSYVRHISVPSVVCMFPPSNDGRVMVVTGPNVLVPVGVVVHQHVNYVQLEIIAPVYQLHHLYIHVLRVRHQMVVLVTLPLAIVPLGNQIRTITSAHLSTKYSPVPHPFPALLLCCYSYGGTAGSCSGNILRLFHFAFILAQ
jgi:hypothetical protein